MVLAFVAWPHLQSTFASSLRYRTVEKIEWDAAKAWLDSASCARRTGALLVICDGDKLLPVSDRALADDPGHALMLGMLARIAGRDADLADAARLNLFINATGLLFVVAILFGLRLPIAALLLLVFGSTRFLSWTEFLPHWSFIGLTAMQVVLPLAFVARERKWMSARLSTVYMAFGLAAVGFAALVREAIATMSLIVMLSTLASIALVRLRQRRSAISLIGVGLLTFAMTATPQLVIGARNLLWNVEPSPQIAAHGMAHTLYIGLGSVPNKFGIVYDDVFGYQAARSQVPDVQYQSPRYLEVMRSLYLQRVMEDPGEVARIYFEKFKLVVGYWFLGSLALPLWGSLPLLIGIQLFSSRSRPPFDGQRVDAALAVNVIALAFIGLTVLQSTLAVPNMFYAMPIALLLLLMMSVAVENVVAIVRRAFGRHVIGMAPRARPDPE